jgi:hypothetical protein
MSIIVTRNMFPRMTRTMLQSLETTFRFVKGSESSEHHHFDDDGDYVIDDTLFQGPHSADDQFEDDNPDLYDNPHFMDAEGNRGPPAGWSQEENDEAQTSLLKPGKRDVDKRPALPFVDLPLEATCAMS